MRSETGEEQLARWERCHSTEVDLYGWLRYPLHDVHVTTARQAPEPLSSVMIAGDEVDLFFPKLGVAVEVRSALDDSPAARADDLRKEERLERRDVRVLWVT